MAGGPVPTVNPVPAIPDIYAVVYAHTDPPRPPGIDRPWPDDEAQGQSPPSTRKSSTRQTGKSGPGEKPGGPWAPGGQRFEEAAAGEEGGGGWASGEDAAGEWRLGSWVASWSREEHAGAVEAVREAIARGDVYQVNVVGHARARYRGDPMPALRRVAALPGARYGGVLEGDGWALATASPETLVEVRDGRVITRPIKGTRPATEQGRRELLASAKERAEHVMIVDLERNDLARLPALGPVTVDELFAVRRWVDLWQADSVVAAPIVGELDLADLLRAICPGGSVTGAPKLAALDEIAKLEPVARGVSMGGVGWVAPDHIDLGLSIRTVAVDGTHVHAWAGGGITWDSDPAAEVDEAAAKAAPIRAALAPPGGSGV
ncbi:chorismate-binding protein [Paractinoplanes globisporus]|uniref:Chorismate-binding protein n=1 Tax=Paractinoplanes globisporus TaxID=113565 RepID=A0ABW6WSK3_9ACTN|nr:chorismate-binding protein [Actinoplanes globisporus]